MSVMENLGYTLLGVIVIVAIIVVIISLVEKKMKKTLFKGRNKRDIFYQEQFKAINKTNSNQTIKGIDSVARNFFAESFQVNKKGYTDLKEFFKKTDNKKAEEFSDLMVKISFAPEKNKKDVDKALFLLGEIISSTHVPSKSEQEELKQAEEQSKKDQGKIQDNKKKQTIKEPITILQHKTDSD